MCVNCMSMVAWLPQRLKSTLFEFFFFTLRPFGKKLRIFHLKIQSIIDDHTTYQTLCPVRDMKGDTFSTTSSRYSRPQEILDHSCSLFLNSTKYD